MPIHIPASRYRTPSAGDWQTYQLCLFMSVCDTERCSYCSTHIWPVSVPHYFSHKRSKCQYTSQHQDTEHRLQMTDTDSTVCGTERWRRKCWLFFLSKLLFFICVKILPSTKWTMTSLIGVKRHLPFLTIKTYPSVLTTPLSSLQNKGVLFSSVQFPIWP